ncbi:unnamed protein product [Prorocentrum cordatum]|uniref:Uncharacterized protein n=1 Tax=Prorocentrum cordatum TaxID=2364126 RepID=A0ABN9UKT5_9DINO|nr:unnamed protein product [Polarella glacialis]
MGACQGVRARAGQASPVEGERKSVKFDTSVKFGTRAPDGDANQPAEVVGPSKRRGRKATGVPTKQQLLAKLQQEDDDDSEGDDLLAKLQQEDDDDSGGDDGSNRAADTHSKRVTIVGPEAAGESGGSQLVPQRKGRKATGVPTKQQLLAKLQQEEDDDSDGDDAPGDHAADTHGKRVTIVVPEAAGESGGPQLAPQRKGRKATGVPTKEQLLAKLQQEDDDDSEGDDGSNRAADTHGKRVTIVVSEAASESSVPQLAPKRVDRKATGAPTKQQLLAKLQQEADDDSEGDDAQGDCPGKAPVAPGKRVKMAAPQSAREPGYARPLLDSAGEHSDPARQQNVRFHAEQEARELPTILAAPKRRGRKATGVVTKEQLLDALAASAAAAAADSEEDGAEEATGAARVRCAGRQCTAFVPAAQAEVLDEGVERAIGPSAGWPFCCQ